MAEPFIGEIRLFPYTYAPVGWAFCDGQLLPTSQNDALFSLLHTMYGGNGTTNFALPDLRGRVPIHMGRGVGLTARIISQKLGVNRVTLDSSTLPQHNHNLTCTTNPADQDSPVDAIPAQGQYAFYSSSLAHVMEMVPGMIDDSGGNESHFNMMPFLVLHFCISLRGVYPPRS